MLHLHLAVGALFAAPMTGAFTPGASFLGQADPPSVTFNHVAIIDTRTGRTLPDRTVVVRGDRIVSVDTARAQGTLPTGRVVEARGKYLMPGLWDMHVHSTANWVERNGHLPLYVANGVLGVRNMWGWERELAQRADIAAGRLLGPRLVVASHILDGPIPMWPNSFAVASTAEARRLVDSVQWRGYDFVKVLSFLPRDVFFAILAEAKQRNIVVAGHVPFAVSADEASAAGLHSVEHLTGIALACSSAEDSIRVELVRAATSVDTGFAAHMRIFDRSENSPVATIDERKCSQLLARLAERQTWQVPTLTVMHAAARITDSAFRQDRRLGYVSPEIRQIWQGAVEDARAGVGVVPDETWQWYLTAVRWMHRAGVPLLAGSDVQNPYVFPGFSLHDELVLLVKAGLTPAEALHTATLNPAIFLGATDSLGTVEVGRLADLVLLDADPLIDIRNTTRIRAVVLRGRYLDRRALDSLLAGAAMAATH